jgi:ribosome-associated heat shock protein Hsp15
MTGSDDDHPLADAESPPAGTQRLDKWLWFARITKSRTLAAHLVQDGKVRVNRARVSKPSQTVRPGDVLTIAIRGKVDVLKVVAPGVRRGPPPEARQLYEVLSSVGGETRNQHHAPQRERGTGRPTKRDRRLTDRLSEQDG